MLNHWNHKHPLSLVMIDSLNDCDGCSGRFRRGERGYRCSQECGYEMLLHEDCAEAPRKIRHAMHPQHTLTQQHGYMRVGQRGVRSAKTNYCTSRTECTFKAHVRCAQGSDMMYGAEDDERSIIHHPSHPNHQLKLFRRSCAFKCDACGTTHAKGSSYACTAPACQYWIHERCASLPQSFKREEHKYNYRCEVCRKLLISKYWIYHCELCNYALHLTCAFNKSPHATREKGIMEFPMSDVAVGEDLIGAFLRRQGLDAHTLIPHQHDVDYEFHHHKIRLVSSSSSSFQEEVLEEENSDDDDEEDYSCRKSELICDGCITPILLKQTSSSSSPNSSSSPSSSNSGKDCYYMRCSISSCKYYLHLSCFQLPTQLSSRSHPLLHTNENENDLNLVLQSGHKLKPWEASFCRVCREYTNGLYYACTKCRGFKVDIKCVSMLETIYHAAHPNHLLDLRSAQDTSMRHGVIYCDACERSIAIVNSYECSICDFIVHIGCAVLPASTTSRRNTKLGQEYDVNAAIHPHPLTFQLLTTKRHCDICRYSENEHHGFYCALCNFFICLNDCGEKMIEDGNIKAVD